MPLDPRKNFASGTLAAGISSTASSASFTTGHGALFPAGPFNATIYNSTDYSSAAAAYRAGEAEIVRITALSGDAITTILRAQEGTTARNLNTAGKTYSIISGITEKLIDDIDALFAVTGQTLSQINVSDATPQTITIPAGSRFHYALVDVTALSGAYTAPIALVPAGTLTAGNVVTVNINFPASKNATIQILDSVGGSVIGDVPNPSGTAEVIPVEFVWTGSAFRINTATASQTQDLPDIVTSAPSGYYVRMDGPAGIKGILATDLAGTSSSGDPGAYNGINTQTTDYTLALSDKGKLVELNSSSAHQITVPPNSSVAFPVGSWIELDQYGTGKLNVVAGAGVMIRAVGGNLALAGQYARGRLIKIASDEWILSGELTAADAVLTQVGNTRGVVFDDLVNSGGGTTLIEDHFTHATSGELAGNAPDTVGTATWSAQSETINYASGGVITGAGLYSIDCGAAPTSAHPITTEVTVRGDAVAGVPYVGVTFRNNGTNYFDFYLYLDGSGWECDQNSASLAVNGAGTYAPGEWHTLKVVDFGDSFDLYVDGTRVVQVLSAFAGASDYNTNTRSGLESGGVTGSWKDFKVSRAS